MITTVPVVIVYVGECFSPTRDKRSDEKEMSTDATLSYSVNPNFTFTGPQKINQSRNGMEHFSKHVNVMNCNLPRSLEGKAWSQCAASPNTRLTDLAPRKILKEKAMRLTKGSGKKNVVYKLEKQEASITD